MIKQSITFMMTIALLLTGVIGIVSAQDEDTTTGNAFLGVQYEEADAGIRIINVVPESPASIAELQVDDVITAVNGETVDVETFADTIRAQSVGDVITLDVDRGDETLTLEVTLAEAPQMPVMTFNAPPQQAFLGIRVEESDAGVVITEVIEDSPAAEIGLQVGDVITQIDGEDVTSLREAVRAISGQRNNPTLSITVERDGETVEFNDVVLRNLLPERDQIIPNMREMRRAFLGVQLSDTDNGVEIIDVQPESPAAEAGLQAGDVITAINGEEIGAAGSVVSIVQSARVGDPVTLTITREDEEIELEIELGEIMEMGWGRDNFMPNLDEFHFDPNRMPELRFHEPFRDRGARLGVTFIMLDEQVAAEYEVEQTEGALITEVSPRSPADNAGLQPNDIVLSVNDHPVLIGFSLVDAIADMSPGDVVTLEVLRDGETLTIEATLGQPEQFGMSNSMQNADSQ